MEHTGKSIAIDLLKCKLSGKYQCGVDNRKKMLTKGNRLLSAKGACLWDKTIIS